MSTIVHRHPPPKSKEFLEDIRLEENLVLLGKKLRSFEAIASVEEAVNNLADDIKETFEKTLVSVVETAFVAKSTAALAGFHFGFFSFAYLSRLAVALAFFFFGLFVNTASTVLAGYRTPNFFIVDLAGNVTNKRTLPDLGHDLIPYIDWYSLPDLMVQIIAIFTAVTILIHPKRLMILRRCCIVFGFLLYLRSYTVIVTSLPDASPVCQAQFDDIQTGEYKRLPIWPTALHRMWLILSEPGIHVACGDMIFSGHTTVLVLCAMVFKQYVRGHQLKWHATHFHYTLDVSIAVFVTFASWTQYHNWARVKWLKSHNRFMQWMEAEEILAVDGTAFRNTYRWE